MTLKSLFLTLVSCIFLAFSAQAGEPVPWQLGFQPAASPVMERLHDFHNIMLVIIFSISAFVLLLLIYVCFRFSAKRNPTPSKTAHHTVLEIVWTLFPVLILLVIGAFSLPILYYADKSEETEMTLKVVGKQWYWDYQYPDHGNFEFSSNVITDADLKPEDKRLFDVDNRVVLPVNTKIKILTTAADVIHAWAIPAFGFKLDAIPGRINEGWIEITKPGVYYGQCSELCGAGHGYMPIVVEAVSKEEFALWASEKQLNRE